MNVLGIILIVLGALGLVFQAITFWTRRKIVDAGPIQIEGTTPETVRIPPLLSVAALVAGIILLLVW